MDVPFLRCNYRLINYITRRYGNRSSKETRLKTAGIIVIGDEILKGDVFDSNSNYVTKALYKLGIKVQKISVIGDDIDVIAHETQNFTKNYNYVITTGGIGPTHDDVTFEAVAKAFNEEVAPHPTLVELCSKFYNTKDLEAPGMKLAFIPKSAILTFADYDETERNVSYPNVSIQNVFMFPGIPQFLQKSMDRLGSKLFLSDSRFFKKCVYCNVAEQFIVNKLNKLVREFPNVSVGSYPILYNSVYKVKVTIESMDEPACTAATERLLEIIPKEYVVNL